MGIYKFKLIFRDGKTPTQGFFGDTQQSSVKIQDLGFPKDKIYRIGIDQSSSATGIYVTDEENTFHLIGDIERGAQNKDRFFSDLRMFMMRMVQGTNLDLFVSEVVVQAMRTRALPVLAQLKGQINQWKFNIPEFEMLGEDGFDEIQAGTWKKHFYKKGKPGKNRFNTKREIALDIMDDYPELIEYFNICKPSSDYDGFDAFGVLQGYLKEHQIDGKVRKIAGNKEFWGDIMIYYRVFDSVQSLTKETLLEGFEVQAEKYGANFAEEDPNISWYSNVRKAASSKKFMITRVQEPTHLMMVKWLMNIQANSFFVIAYICRKNVLSKIELEDLNSRYFNEYMTW